MRRGWLVEMSDYNVTSYTQIGENRKDEMMESESLSPSQRSNSGHLTKH